MSETEACLVFSGDDWFQGAKARSKIWFPEEEPVYPFLDDTEDSARSLRTEVAASGWWALGEWREHRLLEGYDQCEFVAMKGGPWSLHTIMSSVRAAFEVFAYLGVIRHNGPETWLDQDAAVSELGLDVAADFGWTGSGITTSQDPVGIMREAIESLRIETGYVVASQLRETLRARGFGNPDKEIGELLKSGTMILEGEEHGQSRHGEGLFGDPGKQLVRLRVVKTN
ncbi:MAG: hypothetical protein MI807_17905 [Verrucomicrobiales bacterium]|nr:hypothetical protein [Verrucomicrobiales bacterium]